MNRAGDGEARMEEGTALPEGFQHSNEPQPLSPARKKVSFTQHHHHHHHHQQQQKQQELDSQQYDMSNVMTSNQFLNQLLASNRETSSPKPKKKPRPKHYYESPRVYIRTVFMKVGEIDTVKEMFNADIFIQARWREPALDSYAQKKSKIVWKDLWNPGLVIENQISSDSEKVWNDVMVTSAGEAYVLERRRVKGEFSENMELQNFPFDTQHLSLVLTSEQTEVELVEDVMEASLVNHLSFVDEQEWQIRDLVECVQNTRVGENSSLHASVAVLVVRIHATRRSGFFVWNILAIMILICSLAMCTFSVDRSHPSNRLQLSFTLVLTGVAFKFVSCQSLPKISYLTILDKYVLTSMILMHLVCVWHACICLAPASSSVADTLDIVAFFVFLCIFLIFQMVFAIVVNLKIRGKRTFLLQLELQYQAKVNKMMGEGYVERKREEEHRRRLNQRNFLPDTTVGTL